MHPPIHNPTKPHCFLTQRTSNPEASRTIVSEATPCTWQPWLARTAPGPPQESLVRDETRRSLPTNPSLTRTTLGQLCVAPRTSRSRPVIYTILNCTVYYSHICKTIVNTRVFTVVYTIVNTKVKSAKNTTVNTIFFLIWVHIMIQTFFLSHYACNLYK